MRAIVPQRRGGKRTAARGDLALHDHLLQIVPGCVTILATVIALEFPRVLLSARRTLLMRRVITMRANALKRGGGGCVLVRRLIADPIRGTRRFQLCQWGGMLPRSVWFLTAANGGG